MDKYIDYGEVSEYGRNFVQQAGPFVGASELVDVEKLRVLVTAKVDAVESEWQNATRGRSDLREERGGMAEAEEAVRDVVSRFYFHLRSLPKTTNYDLESFFAGGVMGDLSSMKPADLEGKAAEVLRGFEVDKNKPIAGFGPWKTEIETTRQALANAIGGKGNAAGKSFVATAGLMNARKDFLHVYNKVAKPMMRGLLHWLGRENEMRQLFKDLAVNEEGKGKAAVDEPMAGEG